MLVSSKYLRDQSVLRVRYERTLLWMELSGCEFIGFFMRTSSPRRPVRGGTTKAKTEIKKGGWWIFLVGSLRLFLFLSHVLEWATSDVTELEWHNIVRENCMA